MKLIIILMTAGFLQVSATGNSQTVNFSGKDVSMKKVFTVIKSQTGNVFFYDAALLREAKPVTVDLKNVPLETALNEIFKDQPLTWIMENKTITIVKKSGPITKSSELVIAETPPPPPPIQVKGTVTDADGKGIPSVSVTVKGTNRGTTTDNNGNFSIDAENGQTLVFSSVSYGTKEVKVTGAEINVNLQLEVKPLESMIISGNLVAVKRKADVSSVSVIDSKTLDKLPFQNLAQIFRGVVPGTNSIQGGGEANGYGYGSGSVTIRGSAGFGGLGVVKMYIDGIEVPGGSIMLNYIDKNTIDRIEVVKGPSAATLYGSGSNGGVILIYTKKAAQNNMNLNISSALGWYDSKARPDKPLRNTHTIDFTQKTKNISAALGGSYDYTPTYQPGGYSKSYNIYGSLNYIYKKWDFGVNGRYMNNPFDPARNSYYDTSSRPYFNRAGFKWNDSLNVVNSLVSAGANIKFKAFSWWSHELTVGASYNNQASATYSKAKFVSQSPSLLNGSIISSDIYNKGTTIRYSNSISLGTKTIKASLLTGFEYSKNTNGGWAHYAFTQTAYTYYAPTDLENRGWFAQLMPSFYNKVFLTLAVRVDNNNQFGTYTSPRIGATTNFKLGTVTFKPRVAYGVGTTVSNLVTAKIGSISPTLIILPNPDIVPQTQSGPDAGIEIFTNNNRFSGEISYYNYNLKNAVVYSSVPPPSGAATPPSYGQYGNAGKINNNGWEFQGSYNGNRLSVTANYSITNSIMKDLGASKGAYALFGYPGVGDQMQFVAKNTFGATVSYQLPKLFGKSDMLSVSANVTNMQGFINTDSKLSVLASAYGMPFDYKKYFITDNIPGITKFNFDMEYNVTRSVKFFCQIRNIGNNAVPEYGTGSYAVGRGWLLGGKFNLSKSTK